MQIPYLFGLINGIEEDATVSIGDEVSQGSALNHWNERIFANRKETIRNHQEGRWKKIRCYK